MTELYGLIGRKLGHSFSQRFFTEKFANEGIDAQYHNFELETIDQLADILAQNPDLKGFNVTIPYKVEIIPLLDSLSATASAVGAVNCVKIIDGKMHGYNTDAYGFKHTLTHVLEQRRPKALILGSGGGAAQAVKFALGELGIEYENVSRVGNDNTLSYEQLDRRIVDNHKLIINTTPLGMFPNVDSTPNIPYQLISPEHIVYDLVYNPAQTRFMRQCKERGAEAINGSMMLIAQAILSWKVWNDNHNLDLSKLSEQALYYLQK